MMIQQFNYSVNLLQSILWQYSNATNLVSLINQKQAWYTANQSQFWSSWYTNVFNLLTANSFGLSVWSYILNVPLYFENPPDPTDKPLWGFNLYNPSYPTLENTYFNFGGVAGNPGGNFSTKGTVVTLTEEEQRFLLRLRYFQLTTRGDITDINVFLNYLVNTSNIGYVGTIYVLDGLDMTITYVFTGTNFPSYLLEVILPNSTTNPNGQDILPRPAGVGLKVSINYAKQFGFNAFNPSYPNYENTNQNFGNGNFLTS